VRTGRPVISALTGIRALAAVWVVLDHFGVPLFALLPGLRPAAPLVASGFLGVEIFFVLSGFIIAYNYAESLSEGGSYRRYLWARAARIYPVHLAALAAVGVLIAGAALAKVPLNSEARNTFGNFAANVLMAQALPNFQAINSPAWSVSCEFAAYLVFPLLGWWAARLTARRALAWAAAIVVAGVVLVHLIAPVVGPTLASNGGFWTASSPRAMLWVRIGCEFPAGVLLWAWSRDRVCSRRWDWIAVGAAIAVATVCCSIGPSPAEFVVLAAVALFVVACSLASGFVHDLLSTRLMQWGGRISYSLYMTHYLVFLVAKKLIGWERYEGSSPEVRIAVLAVWMGLVIAVAAACFYLVEEPARRLLRRMA
jgi:peptidoglycan/LPS O-acetylase OafA/YrhL